MEVATVTTKDLSLVDNMLMNTKQLGLITSKTPKKFLQERPGKGGGTWTFVTGSYMKKMLNLMFGWDWDFRIIEHKFDLDIKQAYVLGELKCRVVNPILDNPSNKSEIVKMQFGRVDIKFKRGTQIPLDIGNDLKAAATDALKKCASELGIAADIYGKNEFKELTVVEEMTNDEKKELIKKLFDNVTSEQLNETDIMNIERVLEMNEVLSYDKVLRTLKNI